MLWFDVISRGKETTSHPSPLGWTKSSPIPFKGSKCFSKCNGELKAWNLKEIDWHL